MARYENIVLGLLCLIIFLSGFGAGISFARIIWEDTWTPIGAPRADLECWSGNYRNIVVCAPLQRLDEKESPG